MLRVVDVSYRYGAEAVLDGVSLDLERGHIGCILGPSGSGKTTLLRCIAGFEPVHGGAIWAGDSEISTATHQVPAEQRRIGMVFQDYALLPHLDVLKNVAFGLRRLPREERRARAMKCLSQVGLDKLAHRYPHELSGGQQQRVAIARAMAPEPDLLLMDEPFSNLDASLRQSLSRELRDLLKTLGATALVATHDHHDAFAMADDVGVIDHGRLLQWDTAYRLYHRPAARFVAEFVGNGVWLPGRMVEGDAVATEVGVLRGSLQSARPVGPEVDLLLRPDDVVLDDASALRARVVGKQFKGATFLYELSLDSGARLLASVASHHDHEIGCRIGIRVDTKHMVVFPRQPAAI
jgi:iron(III) transport system ATP-binding protein